jgi:hypothetical protein
MKESYMTEEKEIEMREEAPADAHLSFFFFCAGETGHAI